MATVPVRNRSIDRRPGAGRHVSPVVRSGLALLVGLALLPGLASAALAGSDLSLRIVPPQPTAADEIHVRVGEGGDAIDRGHRVLRDWDDSLSITSVLFATDAQAPVDATYHLGVLAPGRYTFLLYRRIDGDRGCRHEWVGQRTFRVRAVPKAGSGRIELALQVRDEAELAALIERERPQLERYFPRLDSASLAGVVPGLETWYVRALRDDPAVRDASLIGIGSVPGCAMPLPTYAPGGIFVDLVDGNSEDAANAVVRRLPPRPAPAPGDPTGPVAVPKPSRRLTLEVPPGAEALFLQRYLRHPEVLGGRIVPQG